MTTLNNNAAQIYYIAAFFLKLVHAIITNIKLGNRVAAASRKMWALALGFWNIYSYFSRINLD